MYSEELQKELIALTHELMSGDRFKDEDPAEVVSQLRSILNYHDWRYYVLSEPIIGDKQYDELFKRLQALETEHPELLTPDSPSQRVAAGLNDEFPTVAHSIPMLSLDNSYNAEDLELFDKRLRELTGRESIAYAVEPKYDGSSIALLYENDQLVRAATRGNGTEGEEITRNAMALRSIPLKAAFSSLGIHKAEVRGEVVIENGFFERMNAERAERGEKTFQNSRNTASGALRLKDPAEAGRRGLEAFIYQLGYAVDKDGNDLMGRVLESHAASIDLLGQLGFKVPAAEKVRLLGIEAVARHVAEWEEKREFYNYEIDGMVVKVDDYALQQEAGSTAHHPRWAIAFKFKAKQATSRLERIEFQVGRTGAVTPVAKISPVPLAGVTISSVSLHNADFIAEKDIRIGDTVIVERAGDVIPYIVGVVPAARTGTEVEFIFPTECPSCSSPLFREADEAAWRCVNAVCPAQLEEKLIHFVSKDAMDIQGLGKDIVRRFMEEGLITDIPSLYRLEQREADLLELEGWKEKSVLKLLDGIRDSKQRDNWRLFNGLGIRHIGQTTAKMLVRQVDELRDFANWTKEQLTELEDVGPIVAESIFDFFRTPSNRELLDELHWLGLNLLSPEEQGVSEDLLGGKSFLFTGTLERMGRDEAKGLVEEFGGKNLSGVSAKLDFLVAGEKAGSKLSKAQKIESIRIITESDFLEMIGRN